jgi:MFS family permease
MSLLVRPDHAAPPDLTIARPPAWRWVHVAVAALAMVATLPGRTHGLGLVTEPLLRDLDLGRVAYASINLWATLLGAAFCLPCGWLIDRLGTRFVLAGVTAALGGVVLVMSRVQGDWLWAPAVPWGSGPVVIVLDLFVLVLLTRGLGQSALSVVSLALVGQAAGRRQGPAIGIYSFLVAVGFMAAFGASKYALEQGEAGWRSLWAGIGIALLGFSVLSAVLVRPSVSGWSVDAPRGETDGPGNVNIALGSMTLGRALATPTFWVFAVATSFYGMVAAGVSLFNQSILEERGFDRSVFLTITTVTPLIGLASNLATGWLATRWAMGRLLAVSMLLLAAALLAFPFVETLWQVYLYAAVMGIAGGMVTVLFFAVWGQAFGPAHLGKIQGAAQMLTVLASAAGPLLLALSKEQTGSYVPLFRMAAAAAIALALAAWGTRLPRPTTRPEVSDA